MTHVSMLCSFSKARKTYGFLDWFQVVLPMVAWARKYKFKQYLLVRCEAPPHLLP